MADTDLPLSMAGAAKARAGKSSSPPSPPGGEGATVPAPLRMGSVRPAARMDAEAWAVVERLEGVLARCGGGA